MPNRRELYEEMGRRNAAAEREAQRHDRMSLAAAGLACLGWCAAGLFLIGWSLHTTDADLGRVAFWSGLLVGNGGIVYTLLGVHARRGRR